MAVGDTIGSIEVVADTASLTIQPSGTVQWVVHNIYAPSTADIEVYVTDGSNPILVDDPTGSLFYYHFHLTNGQYITVKNVSGGPISIGYDGIIMRT